MPKRRLTRTTLERRGRLLFGPFILLTVVACLWWPWWQMERLVTAGDPDRAQALARAELQSRHAIRFAAKPEQAEQLRHFSALTGEKEAAPGPRSPRPSPRQTQTVPVGLPPMEDEAVRTFLKYPSSAA